MNLAIILVVRAVSKAQLPAESGAATVSSVIVEIAHATTALFDKEKSSLWSDILWSASKSFNGANSKH